MLIKNKLLFIISMIVSATCWSISESEKQVRAMFVYNFANFVEWPEIAFLSATSPLQVCLLGDVSFKDYLVPMSGTLIGSRELTVVAASNDKKFKDTCHILFVGREQSISLEKLYQSKKYLYILSVSEQDGFIESGGIVNIIDQSNNISFDIDIKNARRRGLFISSDLLTLARNIKRLSQ